MGYDQYTVPDTVAVKISFIAFLWHAQTYVHGLLCHSFKFLWRTANSKPPTIPFVIVGCTFSDNLSRNSCIQMLLGTERDFVALRYAILKFLRVNLFLCGSEPIFFCLEYISVFYKIMIKKISCWHRLHSLLALSYGLQFLVTFHCVRTWKNLLPSLRVHTCLDSSVSFLLFPCRKDVKWFLYRSLKLVACLMSVVTFRPYETEL